MKRTSTLAAIAVAVALVAGLWLTPLGGYASQLLTIFEPKAFVPIAISAEDREQLRLAPRLSDFGNLTWTGNKQPRGPVSATAAATAAGFALRQPGNVRSLPAGPAQYFVLPAGSVAFTFSRAKAQAYERRFHRHLPPMPPLLDGSTFRMVKATGIVTSYGTVPKNLQNVKHSDIADGVAFVQMPAPSISSSGASMQTLEAYLLSLPNVPPDVAAQLRAISDPSAVLPVPFQIDKATATTVDIDGTQGLAIGDQTGLGSGVLWRKNGMVYAVGGSFSESDLLTLANAFK